MRVAHSLLSVPRASHHTAYPCAELVVERNVQDRRQADARKASGKAVSRCVCCAPACAEGESARRRALVCEVL